MHICLGVADVLAAAVAESTRRRPKKVARPRQVRSEARPVSRPRDNLSYRYGQRLRPGSREVIFTDLQRRGVCADGLQFREGR